MTNVYANLIGTWYNLNEDPNCKIGVHQTSPDLWWEENAEIWSPIKRENEHSLYDQNYVNIEYKGKNYRINPIFIQIVTE
ncbi:hypothetical protein CKN99_05985 [Carnobacterium maltaromaticum]|uniref:hypothetical protein n=1 Tax=Carnobacterium maltaromaticum TaxID=2751 RepID=UPI00107166ED|nr:hypothetical protein [Carnobacterium maltaromaticum]MDT1946057.1 hypothetical protein [Carnobacterium maltaromaticum]MDT2000561.1 hypothetical protein [Carnobacterium maltaromaticum]TFJ28860.1 hypothetical protein CKN90_05940 [Carnobacterium maltaromaticum]TFJ32558.1 hypothetical protein CKN98_05950 [Carnobacterium maltaromaticum]TFJ36586.1 hypothetical protein CKN88_06010 [Carnobacterium maltaromaticum]